jgi:membrane associated rhomboid family serine protease
MRAHRGPATVGWMRQRDTDEPAGSLPVFERLGMSRPPVLTVVLTVLTGAVSVWGLASPAVLAALERTPAAGHGEVWRWLTSLRVQDGGVPVTTSNLIFLALLGAVAEQVVGRVALIVCYLVAGLAGQVAGMLWQPVGAGNSVAVCGLAGIVAWSLAGSRLPRWSGSALALWLGALLATWWLPLVAVGVVASGVDRAVLMPRPALRVPAAVAASAAVSVALVAVGNVHGLALAVGTVIGVVPARRRPAA